MLYVPVALVAQGILHLIYGDDAVQETTLHPTDVDRSDTLEDAIAWVARFVRWYNHEHLHSGIGFVTPHGRHTGADVAQLAGRRSVYAKAHARHPERWTGNVRGWKRPSIVKLQPDREAIEIKPRTNRASA